MLRLTDRIRNRRMPKRDAEMTQSAKTALDPGRARDIARLYTARIWL